MGQTQCCGDSPSIEKNQFKEYCFRRAKLSEIQIRALKDIQQTKADPKTNLIYKEITKTDQNTKAVLFRPGRVFYYGQTKNRLANGSGVMMWKHQEGSTIGSTVSEYEGQFVENNAHGKGKFLNCYVKFDGNWQKGNPKKGKLTPKNQSSQENSSSVTISNLDFKDQTFTEATLDMRSKDFTYSGEVAKIGNQYLYHGKGKIFYIHSMQWYEGNWKQGKYHGQGTYCWEDDKQFRGIYEYGIRNGPGNYKYKDLIYEGEWKDGQKEGLFKITKSDNYGTIKYNAFYNHNQLKNI